METVQRVDLSSGHGEAIVLVRCTGLDERGGVVAEVNILREVKSLDLCPSATIGSIIGCGDDDLCRTLVVTIVVRSVAGRSATQLTPVGIAVTTNFPSEDKVFDWLVSQVDLEVVIVFRSGTLRCSALRLEVSIAYGIQQSIIRTFAGLLAIGGELIVSRVFAACLEDKAICNIVRCSDSLVKSVGGCVDSVVHIHIARLLSADFKQAVEQMLVRQLIELEIDGVRIVVDLHIIWASSCTATMSMAVPRKKILSALREDDERTLCTPLAEVNLTAAGITGQRSLAYDVLEGVLVVYQRKSITRSSTVADVLAETNILYRVLIVTQRGDLPDVIRVVAVGLEVVGPIYIAVRTAIDTAGQGVALKEMERAVAVVQVVVAFLNGVEGSYSIRQLCLQRIVCCCHCRSGCRVLGIRCAVLGVYGTCICNGLLQRRGQRSLQVAGVGARYPVYEQAGSVGDSLVELKLGRDTALGNLDEVPQSVGHGVGRVGRIKMLNTLVEVEGVAVGENTEAVLAHVLESVGRLGRTRHLDMSLIVAAVIDRLRCMQHYLRYKIRGVACIARLGAVLDDIAAVGLLLDMPDKLLGNVSSRGVVQVVVAAEPRIGQPGEEVVLSAGRVQVVIGHSP